jgi:DNA-binding MarR family transcriptional regulator
MFANFMRLLPEEGLAAHALDGPIKLVNFAGLQRWGYVSAQPERPDAPKRDWLVTPTEAGRRAQTVWAPLARETEARWEGRYGAETIGGLHAALRVVAGELDPGLPAFLPIVHWGMSTPPPPLSAAEAPDDLCSLLARVLLAFTLDFERDFPVSLPICADLLRVLGERPIRVGDLPHRAHVSREAIAMALTVTTKAGLVIAEADQRAARGKMVRLTPSGLAARAAYLERLTAVEADWRDRYGAAAIDGLRAALSPLVGLGDETSPLMAAIAPPPAGWRAQARYRRIALPHHPMILHRGAWPDGA